MKRSALLLGFVVASVGLGAGQAKELESAAACARSQNDASLTSHVHGDWRASMPSRVDSGRSLARSAAGDLGIASTGTQLDRMLLLLKPSSAQQISLDAELAAQQTPGSCAYHQWLTAEQFADRYGNSLADVNEVVAWLRSAGFAVAPLPSGRGWVEFSGTAGQVEQAFGAAVHRYATEQGSLYALARPISVPAALKPLIYGLVSLDGSLSTAAITPAEPLQTSARALAESSSSSLAGAMSPELARSAMRLGSGASGSSDGAGETIAIASRSNVQTQDIAAFRSNFGLPAMQLQVKPAGTDPGLTEDRTGATLGASWAGVAAPGAQILVVPAATTQATDGVDLSLAKIIDERLANTVVVGYSACEAALSDAHRAFYASLYRQAAVEGLSVIAATGDSGAAACHRAGSGGSVTSGFAVNGLASTPWNTAVGTAAFAESDNAEVSAWSSTAMADGAYATGGGVSTTFAAPTWQSGDRRTLPDIVLPTAADQISNRGLAFCMNGSEATNGCRLVRAGGSAAAAAIFAGVAADVAQKYGAQGNLAPRLYALSTRTGTIEDVQRGDSRLACVEGTPGCDASGQIGYAALRGYDLATGLGVPNAEELLAAWASPQATGTAATSITLTVSPAATNSTYNPTASITFTASVSSLSSGAAPTGTVQFFDKTMNTSLGSGSVTLDASGNANLTLTSGLAVGGNNVVAIYSGDSTYASATSQPVTVTAQPSTTSMTVTPSTTTPTAGATITVTVALTVGTPSVGTVPPSGKVTLNVDGLASSTAALVTSAGVTTATFSLPVPTTGGAHNLQAIYPGDANYNASTSPAVSITVSKGATVTALTALPATLTPGVAETLTATVSPANAASGTTNSITGTVAFYDGTTLLGTAILASNTATLSNVMLSTATTHVVTAVYAGDANWATSTSNAVSLAAVLLKDTVTLAVTPATAAPGQVVTLTATVTPSVAPASTTEQNPTGNVIFYVGTKVLGTAALTASFNNTSVATLLNATLPAGQDGLTAVYVGDLYYVAGTSNTVTISVQDFTLAPSSTNPPTNLNIVKGNAGTAAFVVTGLGGFNGEISVTCAVPTQDDMTCAPSPQQVTPTGTVTFTVQTYLTGGATRAAMQRPRSPWWPGALGGTSFAALFFFLLPVGRIRRWDDCLRRVAILLLLLTGMGGALMGCTSVSGALSDNSSGTPLGVSTLKITAASYVNNAVVSHSVYLTVNVLAPGTTAAQSKRDAR